jgi:hypothetical protein
VDGFGHVIGTAAVRAEDIASGRINVPTDGLDDGTYEFLAQVIDADGHVRASAPVRVTVVTDRDGVQPSVERAAHGGDFNHDGIADWQQNNVAQLPLRSVADFEAGRDAPQASFGAVMAGTVSPADASSPVLLDAGAQLLDVKVQAPPADLPAHATAASPLFVFTTTSAQGAQLTDLDPGREGLQTRIVIDLGEGVAANTYLKWDAATKSWFDFLDDQRVDTFDDGATLVDTNGDGLVDRVVLTFTDGARGDDDGVANGTVVDPGLLAVREPQATPVFSILLAGGDRFYTASAAEAAVAARGTGNVLEGVRFDSLVSGGEHIFANQQPFTGDWFFAADGVANPYPCYERVPGAAGFNAVRGGEGPGDAFHLYVNAAGITQLMAPDEAAAAGLAARGYTDWGLQFNTTRTTAFVFDPEGYLVAYAGDAGVRELVRGLGEQYASTSDGRFVEAVEQHYLAQVALVGVDHGKAATAADVNAAFGTHFM